MTESTSLAARDRVMRARSLARTPAERLAAMQDLIDRSWAVLAGNPAAVEHYRRRNFRARRSPADATGETDHGA